MEEREERESSVASSADFYGTDAKSTTPTSDAQNHVTLAKRKAEDAPSEQEKKRKLDCPSSPSISSDLRPCARLPPAVWQHVFLYCSLADLGRLIQVNRSFLSYLTDVRNVSTSKPEHGCLRLLKSEALWASARNALPTKPPKPLPGFTELQMWQLAWCKRCQFCNKLSSFTPGERIWQKGPGETGVRTIWPFAVRACGPCLLNQCQTDSSLLFSAASALRPALPFTLLTNDRNYITAYTLQSATTPADIEIGKYYYKKHVTEITEELNDALRLGPAAAEEWSKGLDTRGKERMRVAENWERWEVKHQWWEEHQEQRATSAAPSLAATSHKEPSKSPTRQMPSPVIYAPIPASKYASHVSAIVTTGSAFPCITNNPAGPNLTAAAPSSQYAQARPPTVPPQIFTPHPVSTGSTAPTQRNLHDAIEAKANRKTDIEQRCQQMDPPIPPNILRHMDSFKAAIQISQPMNDYAWSVLEPRLLAQLPGAQQAEADHVSRVAVVPTRTTDRRDGNSKETKEAMDRDWEESQRPIRNRLNAIADDFINQDWDHGNAVTYENSPKFAADLLAYVRRTFYAGAAEDGATADTDTKPRLVLDDMKWVYDNKLKPLTEQFRKEIFLCYSNDCDRNTRFYGFEGIIQHFGARHTNAFSVGNVVVAWREAEWPEEPPFHPDPISVKHAYHAASNSTGYGNYYGGYSRAGTSTPHMQPHLPQASPGPYHYGGQYNGPFAPPQTPSSALPGFGYPQPYATPVDGYSYPAMGAPSYGPQPGHNSYIPSPAMINPAIAPPPAMAPPGQGPADTSHGTEDAGYSTSSFDKQVSTVIGMAQDIWKQTSGIKDMPNSLRVYVLLHRVISKFHLEFNHEPNLNHFIDALSNHEMPKGLKNAPGLSCKACQVASSHQSTTAYYSKPDERKTYTVLNLLSHFKTQHLSLQQPGPSHGQPSAPLDWKEDMIELPNERFIPGLIHAPGMDDEKLLIIATVFPSLFPVPLPKIGVIDDHGVASLASSGPKDAKDTSGSTDTAGDALENSGPSSLISAQKEPSLPPKPADDEYNPLRPTLTAQANEASTSTYKRHSYQDSPPAERRQRYYAEPRYYVGGLQDPNERMIGANKSVRQMSREHLDDGYSRPREYVEYAPSPRMVHPGPTYDEYSGRRTAFREQERFHGPPQEEVLYTHAREGSRGSREYTTYPRQVRYYDEDEQRPEYRYIREPPSREASPPRGQSAADRFLEEFVPSQASNSEPTQPKLLPQAEAKPATLVQEAEDGSRYTPSPANVSKASELGSHIAPLAPPHPRAPSTVSNGSRYEEHRINGHYVPTPSLAGAPRRAGPVRRRDRPHEHRMPSRFYRYMSVARDDPYGRASSMSRSQSRRYEEQRRRIDQQETPQPTTDHDYEPAYSRDPSVDQPSPEDSFYPHVRQQPREYVSVQDRLQPYSPPRYRYDEPHGPQLYVDEYGPSVHEYEIIRVRGEPRQPRGSYMTHQPPRYEPEHYQYVSYERPPPQRHNSRPEEYMYYEERERPLPRRPAPETESEVYEPAPPKIKVEGTPVSVPEGP